MNIQLFPNWVKKIALVSFVVFSFLGSLDPTVDGYYVGHHYSDKNKVLEPSHYYQDKLGGEGVIRLFFILSHVAMIVYFLSKEKVEDDYINLLRLESFQLSFVLIVSISFLFYLFEVNIFENINDGFTLFLLFYLIIFALKKRVVS